MITMLADYISRAIQNHTDCDVICDHYQKDELSEVIRRVRKWQFRDGIELMCSEEIETAVQTGDEQCPEQWIVWTVTGDNAKTVSPQHKEFFSLCQQDYWLKMQQA
ncbi:hypothetical protein [Morganella morganii]|uniref:hypothetical protein n=2 Tax=Morganella morganii TaxID=582 RepID=UPI001050CAE0|nr:hypothetical protein [Morganella morganii]MDW7789587.1 hypothetical protein [Morganella morganii]